MAKLQSTVRIGMAVGAVLLIAGALGFMVWQNTRDESKETSNQAADTSEIATEDPNTTELKQTEAELATQGTIVGSLTYPSEVIPPGLEVFAENIETGEVFSTVEQLQDSRYRYGVGYRLSVPTGKYYVYGALPDMKDQRAYYNNAVECELAGVPWGACEDEYTRIVVNVGTDAETDDIMIANWSVTCVIPGGEQPTEKFDLPTC